MNNRKITRRIALVLTAVLLLTAVVSAGAAGFVGDISGDGKITAFDAQMLAEKNAGLRQLTAEQEKAAGSSTLENLIAFLLGKAGVDVGDTDGDGVFEIYTAEGLRYMAEDPAGDYILKADLDLQGAAWTPIRSFSGSFDGNGHTISNLTITESVTDSNSTSIQNAGFFGDTFAESVITDLALRNVTLTAAADAQFIGLVAGTARGTIENCTVTGSITDTRESLNGSNIFIGVLVGRTTVTALSTTGGTTVSAADDTGTHTVTGLCADAKLYIEDAATVRNNGLYGYRDPATSVTGIWRDSTNNASNESATMQARQNEVVAYMQAMATVEWTVSETMTYTATGVHNQTFEPGTTYYGLPYNGRNGSLERFLYCMDNVDGVNVATTRYGTSSEKANPSGWMLYMGNDCSSAVGWAWMQVSPTRVGTYKVENGEVVDSNSSEYAGGVYVRTTDFMVPSLVLSNTTLKNENGQSVDTQITYRQRYGIYPVGDWTTVGQQGTTNADSIVGTFAYEVTTEVNTADVLKTNGPEVMAEAYAVARKADAIVAGDPAGHARLLTSYPMVIRTADGTIDRDLSFLVCTEQGDGLYDTGNHTSWRVNHKWTFNNLLAYDDPTLPAGYKYSKDVYLPITMRALRADYVKYAYVDEAVAVTSPASGKTYTNWRTVKSTVIVQDAKGTELFRHETYTGLESGSTYNDNYRGQGQYVDLAYAHGEAFNAFAAEHLTEGQTYYYSVQLLMSNGQTLIVSRDSLHKAAYGHSGTEFDSFTYTAG